VGSFGLEHLAQDRGLWRALVSYISGGGGGISD
jgi:hypothetical protein